MGSTRPARGGSNVSARLLHYAALLLAVVGLVLLCFVAWRAFVPMLQGEVAEHQGELELIPEPVADLQTAPPEEDRGAVTVPVPGATSRVAPAVTPPMTC